MINYGITYSTVRPQELQTTATKVFVASNIQEYTDEETNATAYQYNLTEYSMEEFLAQTMAQMNTLSEELAAAKILLGVE